MALHEDYRAVIHLGVGFTFLFAALMPAQNLLSTDFKAAGYWGGAACYLAVVVGNLFANRVCSYWGAKRAIGFGSIPYVVLMTLMLIAVRTRPSQAVVAVLVVGGWILCGFGGAFLWNAQGRMCAVCAEGYDAAERSQSSSSFGYFNGIAVGAVQVASVVANAALAALSGAHVVDQGKHATTLFAIFVGLAAVGCAILLLLPDVERRRGLRGGEDGSGAPPAPPPPPCTAFFRFLMRTKLAQLLLPLFIANGFNEAYMWSSFTADAVTPALGKEAIFKVMGINAAVDALACVAIGRVADRFSLRGYTALFAVAAALNLVPAIYFVVNHEGSAIGAGAVYMARRRLRCLHSRRMLSRDSHLHFAAFIVQGAVILGICDGTYNTLTPALIGIIWPAERSSDAGGSSAQYSALTTYNFWKSGTTSLMFLLGPYISFGLRSGIVAATACAALAVVPALLRQLLQQAETRKQQGGDGAYAEIAGVEEEDATERDDILACK